MVKKTFLILLLCIPLLSSAQQEDVSRFLELGVSANSYKGDLSSSYDKWTSSFHLGVKFNRKKRLNGRIGLMVGNVIGENSNYEYTGQTTTPASPNKFFNARLISLNYDLQINLIKKKNFILYVSPGIGLIRFTPKDDNNNKLEEQFNTRAKNELMSNISFVFPLSIGAMYILPNYYGVGFQAGFINPATDYIDNISEWGNRKKNDNVVMYRLSFIVPLTY